jgi:hypothetical protein
VPQKDIEKRIVEDFESQYKGFVFRRPGIYTSAGKRFDRLTIAESKVIAMGLKRLGVLEI